MRSLAALVAFAAAGSALAGEAAPPLTLKSPVHLVLRDGTVVDGTLGDISPTTLLVHLDGGGFTLVNRGDVVEPDVARLADVPETEVVPVVPVVPAVATDVPPSEPPRALYGVWTDLAAGVASVGNGGRSGGITVNARRGRFMGAAQWHSSEETGNGYRYPAERSWSAGVLAGVVNADAGGVFSIAAGPAFGKSVERGKLRDSRRVGCGGITFVGGGLETNCHTEYFHERKSFAEPALVGVASARVRGPFCLPQAVALGVAAYAAIRPRGHSEAILFTVSVGRP